eukprot:m51a1_g10174 hypothetical protein (404) ;mRNA; r:6799-8835
MSIPSTHEDLMVSCAKWRLEKILYLLTQNINLSCLDASGFVQFLPQVLGPAKGEKLAMQLITATNTLDDLYTTIFAALHDEYAAINRYVDHEQAVKTERSKPHAASMEPKDQKFTFDWAAVKEEKPTLKSLTSIMLRTIEIQSINDTLPMRVGYDFGSEEDFQYTSNTTEILTTCTLFVKLAPLEASGGGKNPRYVDDILCAAIERIKWIYGGTTVQVLYGDKIHFSTLQKTADIELDRKYRDQAAEAIKDVYRKKIEACGDHGWLQLFKDMQIQHFDIAAGSYGPGRGPVVLKTAIFNRYGYNLRFFVWPRNNLVSNFLNNNRWKVLDINGLQFDIQTKVFYPHIDGAMGGIEFANITMPYLKVDLPNYNTDLTITVTLFVHNYIREVIDGQQSALETVQNI